MSNINQDDDAPASPLPSPSITTTTTTVITGPGTTDRPRADGAPASAPDSRTGSPAPDGDTAKTLHGCVVPRPGDKAVCGRVVQLGGADVGSTTDDDSDSTPSGAKRRR